MQFWSLLSLVLSNATKSCFCFLFTQTHSQLLEISCSLWSVPYCFWKFMVEAVFVFCYLECWHTWCRLENFLITLCSTMNISGQMTTNVRSIEVVSVELESSEFQSILQTLQCLSTVKRRSCTLHLHTEFRKNIKELSRKEFPKESRKMFPNESWK